jgi:hypothetical protein
MKTSVKLWVSMLAMIGTLACAFVQNMIFPPTQSPTSSPLPAFTPVPTVLPEPITCTDDNCLQACLNRLDEVLQTRPFDPVGNAIYEEQGAEFNLVIYRVNGDEITEPAILYVPSEYRKYQEDTDAHLRVWKFYVAMIPAGLRTNVDEFIIFTDGSNGETSAWVRASASEAGSWQVGIDLLDSDYPAYLADTLVHETAHLLTLNNSQIPSDENFYYYDGKQEEFLQCKQYATHGGCSLPESYINLFYREFWKDSYHEWWELEQEAQNAETSDEYFQVMDRFYENHQDWFVNSYAATDLEEDMAESFAYFVLHPRPSGNTIYEQKINFYYEFPELVDYRKQMIEGLCSYIR